MDKISDETSDKKHVCCYSGHHEKEKLFLFRCIGYKVKRTLLNFGQSGTCCIEKRKIKRDNATKYLYSCVYTDEVLVYIHIRFKPCCPL